MGESNGGRKRRTDREKKIDDKSSSKLGSPFPVYYIKHSYSARIFWKKKKKSTSMNFKSQLQDFLHIFMEVLWLKRIISTHIHRHMYVYI